MCVCVCKKLNLKDARDLNKCQLLNLTLFLFQKRKRREKQIRPRKVFKHVSV